MNEIDYGALFGIDEGGKEQEAADPAQSQEEQAQGDEVQEAADPAEEDQDNTQQTTGADDQASEEDADVYKRQELEDLDDYQARKLRRCVQCGAIEPLAAEPMEEPSTDGTPPQPILQPQTRCV